MNPLLISALLSAAISFGAAWQVQSWRIDSLKLEHANELISHERAGRQALADAQAKVTAAQDAAKVATDRVKRDVAGADRAGLGVRDALANSVRAAHGDLQACTGQVNALSVVFAQCADVARTVAAEADSWAVDRILLQEAWPK